MQRWHLWLIVWSCWLSLAAGNLAAQWPDLDPTWHPPSGSPPGLADPVGSGLPRLDGPQRVAPPETLPVQPPGVPLPSAEVMPTMPEIDSLSTPLSHPEPMGGMSEWFSPSGWSKWFGDKLWTGGLEIGINGTGGNSDAFSSRYGGNLKRKTELWEFKSDFIYTKASANGVESQNNAIVNAGYERFFPESPWTHFGKYFMEYNEFKAFDLRIALNAGMGYQFIKTDRTNLKTRFGAGVSHEIDSPDSRWVPEAVFGGDWTHDLSKRQKLALTSDYYPEWGDFSSYRLVSNANWTISLDEASKLSLKMSVNDLYDSTPNGRKPNDVIYAVLLLWQM